MNVDELQSYYADEALPDYPAISAKEFKGHATLTHGYTLNRHTFHVYIEDDQVHRVVYDSNGNLLDYVSGEQVEAGLLVPSKRAYPQYTQLAFARRMRQLGHPLTLTTMGEDNRPADAYKGKRLQELTR